MDTSAQTSRKQPHRRRYLRCRPAATRSLRARSAASPLLLLTVTRQSGPAGADTAALRELICMSLSQSAPAADGGASGSEAGAASAAIEPGARALASAAA